jgi:hypothetical protein
VAKDDPDLGVVNEHMIKRDSMIAFSCVMNWLKPSSMPIKGAFKCGILENEVWFAVLCMSDSAQTLVFHWPHLYI